MRNQIDDTEHNRIVALISSGNGNVVGDLGAVLTYVFKPSRDIVRVLCTGTSELTYHIYKSFDLLRISFNLYANYKTYSALGLGHSLAM